MIPYIATAVGFIGLMMAWRAGRANTELKERLERVTTRVYDLRREMTDAYDKSEQELMQLKFELMSLKGKLKISDETHLNDIYAMHPQAQAVLAGFHIGGCSSCAVDDRQTLGEAVTVNGREIEPILVALNNLVADTNGPVGDDMLKMPNIQLQL